MTTTDDEKIVHSACIAGPEALRALMQSQGVRLAARMARSYYTMPRTALRAVVTGGAPLSILDVLEEYWPGLETTRYENGLTDLIAIESQWRADLLLERRQLTDVGARAVIQDVYKDVRRRVNLLPHPSARQHPRYCPEYALSRSALSVKAYYTYEALMSGCAQSLSLLTENTIFTYGINYLDHQISEVLQDVVANLILVASEDELFLHRERLIKCYDKSWSYYAPMSDDDYVKAYGELGVFLVNMALVETELRQRRRMLLFLTLSRPSIKRLRSGVRVVYTRAVSRDVFELIADFL